jgi:hypothetical protein
MLQLFQTAARCNLASKRILVVGSDNIDVGKQTAPRQPGQPTERSAAGGVASAPGSEKTVPPKKERGRISGAMSQQRGDSGHDSAPQKFVQLVGYRDPKARLEPWVRPTRPPAINR